MGINSKDRLTKMVKNLMAKERCLTKTDLGMKVKLSMDCLKAGDNFMINKTRLQFGVSGFQVGFIFKRDKLQNPCRIVYDKG